MKKSSFELFVVVALAALIIIRFFVHEAHSWISCLNYFGLVIAVCGLLIEFSSRCKKSKTADFIKGMFRIVIAILIVIGCLLVTGAIRLSVLANDEILLWTLLISLPANYYCVLLGKIVDKQNKKGYKYGKK